MSTNRSNKDSWNKHAARYQNGGNFSFDRVDYCIVNGLTEFDLGLIGNVSGKKVLEIGCGAANCGIALAKQGAIVTCVDISEQQIKHVGKEEDLFHVLYPNMIVIKAINIGCPLDA